MPDDLHVLAETFRYKDREYMPEEGKDLLIEIETIDQDFRATWYARQWRKRVMSMDEYHAWKARFNTAWLINTKTIRRLKLWLRRHRERVAAQRREERLAGREMYQQQMQMGAERRAQRQREELASLNDEERILLEAYLSLKACYFGDPFTDEDYARMNALQLLLCAKGINVSNVQMNMKISELTRLDDERNGR